MTTPTDILTKALADIQTLTWGPGLSISDVGHHKRALENIGQVAAEALKAVKDIPTHESDPIVPERMSVGDIVVPVKKSPPTFPLQALSMELIQTDLTKRYPQGWVLAWTEAVTKPPINQSDGRSEGARTEWSDSCAAHGSVSQRLGLAAFLKGSIKHNIIRRNA